MSIKSVAEEREDRERPTETSPGDRAAALAAGGQVTPAVFSVPRDTKPDPLVEKGHFIDSIKAPLSSQDEIRNLLIPPTQIQAEKHALLSHCKC